MLDELRERMAPESAAETMCSYAEETVPRWKIRTLSRFSYTAIDLVVQSLPSIFQFSAAACIPARRPKTALRVCPVKDG
jgi:hypothetical protein